MRGLNHIGGSVSTWLSGGGLAVLVLACILAPVLLPLPGATGGSILEANLPPASPGHLLGTDANGNDILARLLVGGRYSLSLCSLVLILSLTIGLAVGALSVLRGGVVDYFTARTVDALVAFPSVVVALALSQTLSSGFLSTLVALTLATCPAFVRVARTSTLQLRDSPFVLASQISGAGTTRILVTHVVPNVAERLTSYDFLRFGYLILAEGALCLLGLGPPSPQPTWGVMIAEGQASMVANPWAVITPSLTIFLCVVVSNSLASTLNHRERS